MRLVDAHHHLWDLAAVDYPWLRARGETRFFGDPTPIQRDYLVADLRRDAAGYELLQSVHVQVGTAPGVEIEETRWLEVTAAREGLPTAIVAFVDLTRPDLDAAIDAHCASSRVRGFRQIVGRRADEDARTNSGRLLENAAFARGLERLAARGLSFDLQVTAEQLPRAAQLLERIENLNIALCHCGSPWDRSREGLADWEAGLAALARVPGAHCKLSGISMLDPAWTQERFSRIVRTVLDRFGPERCMWGSNFPVDRLYRRYGEIVEATLVAIEPCGADAREAILVTNAQRFYRL